MFSDIQKGMSSQQNMQRAQDILFLEIEKFKIQLLQNLNGSDEETLLWSYQRSLEDVEDLVELLRLGPTMWTHVIYALNLTT